MIIPLVAFSIFGGLVGLFTLFISLYYLYKGNGIGFILSFMFGVTLIFVNMYSFQVHRSKSKEMKITIEEIEK